MIEPGSRLRLSLCDPGDTPGFNSKASAARVLEKNLARLAELQYLLYAQNRHALLIVLQGPDASGKDGTIRHVMSGLNPQGVVVTPFKVPQPRSSTTTSSGAFIRRFRRAATSASSTARTTRTS